MGTLLELAARCEAATGPDRELDALIYRALAGFPTDHWYRYGETHLADDRVPAVTASLDAAMTLIPEGWDGALYLAADAHKPCVQLETPEMRSSFRMLEEMAEGTADSLALALTAACLRARASLTGEKA
jgi:hypothetical protein